MADENQTAPDSLHPPVDTQSDPNNPTPTAAGLPETPTVTSQPAQATDATKIKRSKKPIIIAVVLIILIAIGAGLLLLNKHNNSVNNDKKDIPLIRYGFYNNPLNAFYPTNASDNGVQAVQDQLFEGLVAFQDGTQIKPQLAASWSNPNDTTWIFNLKPNIYYHDGDKVTAADVVNTWKEVSTTAGDSNYSTVLTNTIKNVSAVNDSTVKIVTSAPDPILLNRLSQLFILDSKAPKGTPAWELGTGAYTVKPGTTPSANDLDLVAFNKWHGGHIYTRALDYIFYADQAKAVNDLKAGKLNVLDGASLNQVTPAIQQDYEVFKTAQAGSNIVFYNSVNSKYPTSNLKIREAMSLAMNNTEIMNNSEQVGTPIDQLLPPSIPGYNPDIKAITRNAATAAALVKSAGYPNGVTVNLGVGEPILSVAQQIAAELKPAGININIQEATSEDTYFNNVSTGAYQSWIEGVSTSLLDGSDMLQDFVYNPGAQVYYNNPDFNKDVAMASTDFSATQHLADLQKAALILSQDYAYSPLYQEYQLNFSDKGIVYPFNDYDTDLNVYFANVYQKQ